VDCLCAPERHENKPGPEDLTGSACFTLPTVFRSGHYPSSRVGRFAFAAAVYAGWLIGFFGEISDSALAILFSFLAGGIIVLATVYEIPGIRSERQYRPFLAGAGIFSALMLAKDYF
jgi:hypothetical protein